VSVELIREFMEDLGQRNIESLRRWFFEDSVLWMPPMDKITGDRRILAAFRLIFRGYSDLHWSVTNIMATGGNRFVYETDSWGTIGQATPYKNHILTIIEFDAQGRIVFLSDYFKDTAIFNAEKKAAPPVSAPSNLAAGQ